jgi:hypothetical protein
LACSGFRTNFSEPYESIWTVGRTPWTGDRPDARPLPTHRITQHRKTRTHIHAMSRIRTHDPSVRTAEDSTCLRLRGHWDRQYGLNAQNINIISVKNLKYISSYLSHFSDNKKGPLIKNTASGPALGLTQPPLPWVLEVGFVTHLHLVPSLGMRGAMPLLPHASSWRGGW